MDRPGDAPPPAVCLGAVSFAHGHINRYRETSAGFTDARASATWDGDCDRRSAQCAKYGPRCELDLAAAFVSSPIDQHIAQAIVAAGAGKGALLQKRMMLILVDYAAIIAGVSQYGVSSSTRYQMLADQVNQRMKARPGISRPCVATKRSTRSCCWSSLARGTGTSTLPRIWVSSWKVPRTRPIGSTGCSATRPA